jgi:FtsP/CotA-like multicopper oxidase with cupredoxin domain
MDAHGRWVGSGGGAARRLTPLLGVVVLLTFLAPLPSAGADDCGPTAGDVTDPDPFQWTQVGSGADAHYVGTLQYGEASFVIGGETLTTRAYRQAGGAYSIPGPTIHMTPGERYVLRFENLLPYEPATHEHNTFTDPNVTNVHTHGLHISGEAPGDDVTRMFEGGTGGDYVYDIPADHMGGTFWYHAHHHGSTFLQVSTGGFGLIVIDDAADGLPSTVAAMQEQQVLLGYLDPGAAGTGGDTIVGGTLAAGWTVNGEVGATLCLPPGTWQHWRVLLADRDAKPKDVSIGAGCEVKLLARDGVWRTTAPKDLPTRTINLTGASRADLAVRCSTGSDVRIGTQTVASIRVAGTSDTDPSPYGEAGGTWSAHRPSYLRDLRGATDVHRERINMGARTVNGTKFDVDVPNLTLTADAVQEWDLRGASNHPFHLHVYHVQAQAGCGGDFEEGEYYDVMAASCAVRFDLNAATSSPYDGRTIMHCHILEHEDQGAMGWMDVIGGTPPPTFPAGQGYGESYTLGLTSPSAPTDLTATATSSSTIALAWTDTSVDETGFELERSGDGGVTFAPLATLGADVTSYDDTGLSADTTYAYRARAVGDGGTSAWSAPASATTLAGGGTSDLSVSVSVAVVDLGRGFKGGEAVVAVLDASGQPVAGATVTGAFSGTFEEGPLTALTDSAGTATFATAGSSRGSVSITFCVSDVTHASLTYSGGEVCASG